MVRLHGRPQLLARKGMQIEKLVQDRLRIKEINFHTSDKLLSFAESKEFVNAAHRMGKTVILVEGTWDLTHAGHVQHIREAVRHGDLVLLRLASAKYAEKIKGKGRPIEVHRDMVVSEFENVDAVFVDATAITPDDIQENANMLALLNVDAVALETEDDKLPLKLSSVIYANEHLGVKIKPIIMTLDHLNSTTGIINKIQSMSSKMTDLPPSHDA